MAGKFAKRSALVAGAVLMLASMFALASAPADAQEAGGSHFQLNGTPGDWITQGNDVSYTDADEVTFAPSVNYDNGITVIVEVRDNGAFVARWSADFAAPNEVPLVAGDAFSATRFPFQAADTAGLSISGAGRGCNMLAGDFIVHELTMTDGEVELFDADFTQACDGGPAMAGSVRYAPAGEPPVDPDTTPPEAFAGLDQVGRIKRMSSDFVVQATCSDNEDGVELLSAEINGATVSDGQTVRLVISSREKSPSYRKGKLTVQSSSIELVVNCVDASGNTDSAAIAPVYQAG